MGSNPQQFHFLAPREGERFGDGASDVSPPSKLSRSMSHACLSSSTPREAAAAEQPLSPIVRLPRQAAAAGETVFSARRHLSRPPAFAIPATGAALSGAYPADPFSSPRSPPAFEATRRDAFALLPDELIVDIFSRVGCGGADVSVLAVTCRRWRALTRYVPALRFTPADLASRHVAGHESQGASACPCRARSPAASPARLEELVSRMVLKSKSLQHLHVASALVASVDDGEGACACTVNCGAGCGEARCAHSDGVNYCSLCGSNLLENLQQQQQQQHPREFIFEAWMRHVGSQLQSLVLSRSLESPAHCGGSGAGGSLTVNVWENEDLSAHLCHVARHCSSLRSLSLGSLSLSPSLLTCQLPPMRHLEHLSLSWIHASNESLQAVLDAAPKLRRLSIFMATGSPRINLRLSATVEHVELAYLRAESCTLLNARALRSLSVRDMFVRYVTVRDAPDLRHVAVASASVLQVAAPDSPRLASVDLKAGSFVWPAIKALVQSAGTSLISFALDFFSAGPGAVSAGVFSLTWLAAACPNLKALSFGALPWQLVVSWAAAAGAFRAGVSRAPGSADGEEGYAMCASYPWPQLAEIRVRVREERPEALLLLHTMLCRMPGLRSLQVSLVGGEEGVEEEEEEGEFGEEEMGEEGEEEAMEEGEEWEEEGDVEMVAAREAGTHPATAAPATVTPATVTPATFTPATVTSAATGTTSAGYVCAAKRQELFVKGLACLQQRFSHVRVCSGGSGAHRTITL